MKETFFCNETNSAKAENFDSLYPILNNYISRGDNVASRNGGTSEVLDFKTIITNPIQRCVGTHNRDINIFFLLAEAIWIWAGKNDVEFLKIFNSRMSNFSDNRKTFHAPYGFRMRNYGVESNTSKTDSNKHAFRGGIDQLRVALEMLEKNEDNRRVVISIWNPDLDLAIDSKDIPCNDMLMFKIRDGKLNITVQNRSNDLHWGLPTNVFQFSWILELMAEILRVDVGTQVHNSQSLHIYNSNPITGRMKSSDNEQPFYDGVYESNMNLNPDGAFAATRLKEVDETFEFIIDLITQTYKSPTHTDSKYFLTAFSQIPKVPNLLRESVYLQHVVRILNTYAVYASTNRTQEDKLKAIKMLIIYYNRSALVCQDYYILAMNWFASRIDRDRLVPVLVKHSFLGQFKTHRIGKL